MRSAAVALLASAALVQGSVIKVREVAPKPFGDAASLKDGPFATHTANAKANGVINAAADVTPAPDIVTFTLVNSHTNSITTAHADNADASAPVGGPIAPGTLTVGETATFAVPTGWAGQIGVNDANFPVTGDDSLLQGAFVYQDINGFGVVDVAVSYVNGYTLPITCSCDNTVVSGCNKWLIDLGQCPQENQDGQGSCVNPLRSDTGATAATPFFAPCQGAAYTFPNDSAANSNGACQSGQVSCCVGAACPANPKQPQ